MNNYIKYIAGVMAIVFAVASCTPIDEKTDLGDPPAVEQLAIEFKYDEGDANIIHFTNASEVGFNTKWDFGNGTVTSGIDEATIIYPLKGEYTVSMTVFTKGGSATVEKVVEIAQTNPVHLNKPEYNLLTGGVDALEGKTWVLDGTQFGHMGVGPVTNEETGEEVFTPDWWQAPPGDKEGLGLYDDQITFKLDGFSFMYETNGAVFANGGHAESIGGTAGEDQAVPFTYDEPMNWSITETEDGRMFITISNGGHIGFYTGASTYEILKLEENELYIRNIDGNGGLAWYQRLIPLGYEHPVEEPEYKSEDISSDFEGNSNISWYADEVATFVAGYDNPATFGANTSTHVAKYVKGEGEAQMWANLQIPLEYKIDLTTRNKFTLKIYLPSYNDYTTESAPDWWSVYRQLKPMVAVKLQDSSLGGNAYTTQAEVKHENLALDQWHELEFDFSSVADREDFDKIVIQIGGEGHYIPGTFFFDDFMLQ